MGILRLLFAISVISIHYNPSASLSSFGEEMAVNSFFILSGFYMAFIVNEKYDLKRYAYWLFVTNRFLRIYPLYWIVLILTIITNYFWLRSYPTLFLYRPLLDIISDFTLLIRADYVSPDAIFGNQPTVIVAWTLIIELTFYLCAPFLVKRNLVTLIGLTFFSIVIKYSIAYYQMLHQTYHQSEFFLADLCFFLLGVLSYKTYTYLQTQRVTQKQALLLLFFVVCLTIFWKYVPAMFTYHKFSLKEWIYSCVLMLAIPPLFSCYQCYAFDTFFGKLSYPVYISHILVGNFLIYNFHLEINTFRSFVIILLTTLIFSLFLFFCIDNPLDTFRQKRLKVPTKKRKWRKRMMFFPTNMRGRNIR